MQFTHQRMHYLLTWKSFKIYIKIRINIAPKCFGLRPSSGSFYCTLLKLQVNKQCICWCANYTNFRMHGATIKKRRIFVLSKLQLWEKMSIFKMSINLPTAIIITISSSSSTVTVYDVRHVSNSIIFNNKLKFL